ncbi:MULTISPECIES: hypothetical protein [unclassified Streptomyces]|uniref:hypothetical protein n=1 Tax=unclassified Streptomyces TaxID=2593676 RepID=UPI002E81C5A5|nr:hypothetical protein [Streptomyces sp. NBC_00589]WTI37478.1 hypothetical protein OIC96_21895 [Streptomyces sp. NBC_00775]WUB28844.1 hypothetical protein OHA51_27840 [Streptomyces sp. NBC_00589]
MSVEDSSSLPIPQTPTGPDPVLSAGMNIAMKWGEVLGPEKLEIALKALEPQLKRDHQAFMKRLDMQREAAERADAAAAAAAEREAQEKQEQRRHNRHMAGLAVGAVVAIAMLGAGVYVAQDAWWLAALLCGPSLLALAKIFVLRRSDPDDMKFVAGAARSSTNAASQVQPPAP